MESPKCPICERELGTKNTSKHHLTPKSRGGKSDVLVELHNICHQKIHSLFTTKELKEDFDSVDKLLENEEMVKFVKWVAKKAPAFYQRNHKANRRK